MLKKSPARRALPVTIARIVPRATLVNIVSHVTVPTVSVMMVNLEMGPVSARMVGKARLAVLNAWVGQIIPVMAMVLARVMVPVNVMAIFPGLIVPAVKAILPTTRPVTNV